MDLRARIVASSVMTLCLSACGGSPEHSASPAASASAERSLAAKAALASARAAASASAAPSVASSAPEPPPPPKSPKEIVSTYVAENLAAFGAHDAKKIAALYAPRAVIASPGPAGLEETGRADMARDLAALFDAFPDAQLSSVRLLSKGHLAVWEWTLTGTNTGEFMGKPATKKRIGYRGVSVLSFGDDGLVKRETMYFDFGTVLSQLGLGPKKQAARPADAAPSKPEELFVEGDSAPEGVPQLRAFYDARDKADDKALATLLRDDVQASVLSLPSDQKKADFVKSVKDAAKAFPDAKTDPVACFRFGDYAVCERVWTATSKGPFLDMKATNKRGTVHGIDVARLAGDQIAMLESFENTAEMRATFGASDPSPKTPTDEVKLQGKGGAKKPPAPKK